MPPPAPAVPHSASPAATSAAAGSSPAASWPAASGSHAPAAALELAELLAEDLRTYDGDWSEPGFLAIGAHRLGTKAAQMSGISGSAMSGAHKLAATAIDWLWGIKIPLRVQLGRRIRIWHHGGVLLDARSIGNDVHLRHNTTFGPLRGATLDEPTELPVIANGADLGSGACVLGPVRVGERAVVGANTVVLKDIPDGATVLGVPGRVIPA